jgi:hypothetical protein
MVEEAVVAQVDTMDLVELETMGIQMHTDIMDPAARRVVAVDPVQTEKLAVPVVALVYMAKAITVLVVHRTWAVKGDLRDLMETTRMGLAAALLEVAVGVDLTTKVIRNRAVPLMVVVVPFV